MGMNSKKDISLEEVQFNIKDTVARCFSKIVGVPLDAIEEDADFFEYFNMDSLDYFLLLTKIKTSFDYPINDQLIAGQRTVKGFCDEIMKLAR